MLAIAGRHVPTPMARRELFLALLWLAALALATGPADATRKMVGAYELRKGDFSVRLTNWGARVMSVVLPDCKGPPVVASFVFLPLVPRFDLRRLFLQGIWLMSSLAETPSLNTS
jgi:hypothetical protein